MIIRRIIKRNVFLYYLWFHLYRNNRGVKIPFFVPATSLYICGYPRSGNTYFAGLVKNIFPDIGLVHHLHAIAPVKIALLKNISTFVLIREPLEAISSNYLKHYASRGRGIPCEIDSKCLKWLLVDYVDYYDFIIKNVDALQIINFSDVKENFTTAIKLINNRFDMGVGDSELKSGIEYYSHTFRGATDLLGASTPTAFKEEKKVPLKRALRKLHGIDRAEVLHAKLTELSI